MSVPIRIAVVLGLCLWAACASLPLRADDRLLTLAEAERLAIESAPMLARQNDAVAAAGARAGYEDRLPDPQLAIGALNVPTDSFRFDAEEMTMVMVGLRQSFPAGRTLRYRGERAQHELERERARADGTRRDLLRQVRLAWLDLYALDAEGRVIERMRPLMTSQREAAEGRYRAGADSMQKMLEARQMADRLIDRDHDLRARRARAEARLAVLIGADAYRPLPEELPTLPVAKPFAEAQHPEVRAADAEVAAAQSETAMAREEYKPGMMVEVSYGSRQNRPDMMSAVLTFDLPLFPGRVQDRKVAEKRALEDAAQREREERRRLLEADERAARIEAESLDQRLRLYTDRLLPDADRQTHVTVAGFARDQSEYREARLRALDTEIEYTRLRAERARVQAELLYLAGETQP